MLDGAVLPEERGAEEELEVGRLERIVGADEGERLGDVRRELAAAPGEPAHEVLRVRRVGEADVALAKLPVDERHRVFLEVRADLGAVDDGLDPDRPEVLGRSDARELEQVRAC